MPWTKKQIEQHIRAARVLGKIKNEFFLFLKENVSEYDAMEFVWGQYRAHGLWSDHKPIVAFGQNTSFVHYFPSQYCRKLCAGNIILLDIWARVREAGAPFADMTWMGFCGRDRNSFTSYDLVNLVFRARDESIRFLRNEVRKGLLSRGKDVDAVAREVFRKAGYGEYFLHGVGHSLGFRTPHGAGVRLAPRRGEGILEERTGYTIEPGVYITNTFGMRSEIDFYIDGEEVIITTPVQRTVTVIGN